MNNTNPHVPVQAGARGALYKAYSIPTDFRMCSHELTPAQTYVRAGLIRCDTLASAGIPTQEPHEMTDPTNSKHHFTALDAKFPAIVDLLTRAYEELANSCLSSK